MAYALYEVLYKRGLGDGGSDDARLVNVATGLVGVCSIVIAAPGCPVLDSLGVEPFELPPSVTVTLWLALNGSARTSSAEHSAFATAWHSAVTGGGYTAAAAMPPDPDLPFQHYWQTDASADSAADDDFCVARAPQTPPQEK